MRNLSPILYQRRSWTREQVNSKAEFKRDKMATLKQVLLLQATILGPDWVMSPLCWTTTSYQVSHKGSFIKLDAPLVFIALIKEHKRQFFSAFGCWIINSINWTQLNFIDLDMLVSKRQLPTTSRKEEDMLSPAGVPGPQCQLSSLSAVFLAHLCFLPLCS